LLACLHLLVFGEAAGGTVSTEKTNADVVGASVSHPAEWSVERERYTFGDTYGFTLWKPESDPASHDHGGRPAVRVALAYDLQPEQIEAAVREKLAAYSHLSIKREEVSVGEKEHRGVAVGPIPGSTPSTEVYVPVNGRVYQINVCGEELGADVRELLSNLRFDSPSRSVRSLGLPDGRRGAARTGGGGARGRADQHGGALGVRRAGVRREADRRGVLEGKVHLLLPNAAWHVRE
jgi:hypothetical protein